MTLRFVKYLHLLSASLALIALSAHAEPDLSAPEAAARAQSGQLVLIDIRTPPEWKETGLAKGAKQVNMMHPQGARGFVDQLLGEINGDRSTPIALICRTGNRTTSVQRYLQSVGFTQVYNVREGMAGSGAGPGWLKRGLPVEPCTRQC